MAVSVEACWKSRRIPAIQPRGFTVAIVQKCREMEGLAGDVALYVVVEVALADFRGKLTGFFHRAHVDLRVLPQVFVERCGSRFARACDEEARRGTVHGTIFDPFHSRRGRWREYFNFEPASEGRLFPLPSSRGVSGERLQAEYERMQKLGVVFRSKAAAIGPVTLAVFEDTCGNLIQMFQVEQETRCGTLHPKVRSQFLPIPPPSNDEITSAPSMSRARGARAAVMAWACEG